MEDQEMRQLLYKLLDDVPLDVIKQIVGRTLLGDLPPGTNGAKRPHWRKRRAALGQPVLTEEEPQRLV